MQNTPINNTPSQKSGSSTKISTYIGPYINNQRNGKGKLIIDKYDYQGNFKSQINKEILLFNIIKKKYKINKKKI